ncbi:MAG: hypothetical protein H8D34_30890 [Chloroflexi bacterium]|nr:hypothetical protein [Chloroflexota bacterium]MBL7160986.1 hypothetical protein [Anaerolineales bacterium]
MQIIRLIWLGFLVTMTSACQSGQDAYNNPDQSNQTSRVVDTRFSHFYDLLGGEGVLGPPISPKFSQNGREYQYTTAALMVCDPQATSDQSFQLAPIGVEIGIAEPPKNPGAPGGHAIFSDFQGFYEQLGGAQVVGLPLTDVRYNPERGGVEQYFENLGFYQLESDPLGEIRLLGYGAWMCGDVCAYESLEEDSVMLSSVVDTPFAQAVQRLPPQFVGKPLTEPHTAPDGQLEQIFENMVIIAAPERPGEIALRPITAMLGVEVSPDGEFDIPEFFMEYLNQNSGLEFSGPAVTGYERQGDDVFRQCFLNLCLDHYPNSPEGLQVKPTLLGYLYKSRYYQASVSAPDISDASQPITLEVWEGYPLISPDEPQLISVAVYNGLRPMENVELVLTLILPDGNLQIYSTEPTREDGKAFFELDPISAPHGTSIQYSVCIAHLADGEICVEDDFLIWGNP